MEKNINFYYGILFYILFLKGYKILCDLITSLLLALKANIYLIPILLLLITTGLLLLFIYMKKLPPLKLWILLIILILSVFISFLNLPGKYYMGTDSFYTAEQQSTILNLIYLSKGVFTLGVIVISYFKYLSYKKLLSN
jgi:hypothetical protein